ncbi:MAG TPA: iron chelate uptake ABC transporter family permease subunit [Candidatus Polarisedimenticolia bacterium]|nr:iron chelate uptake ABC transporter family permease subunit [Candidatus Polarisedimenticolia bacterium]
MSEALEVLVLPFLACLVLTGIHAYLGIHVLSRKVIFVDIALAQIAALGATVAFLLGHDPRSGGAYWFSLSFAVAAAAVFALTRTRRERVPQEAIIGLTYAVASAAAILLADASPHGAEHLKDLLAGSIVWVTPHQLARTAVLYAVLGIVHVAFRRTFLLISLDPERAYASGVRVRLWDFLFYLTFGVVITSSVQIAGVLLVFCYLVAPAVFGAMFSDRLRTRLLLGWGLGTVVSAAGLLVSYDRPSGPTIMVCFALALALGGAARWAAASLPRPAAGAVMAALAAAALSALWWGAHPGESHPAGHRHPGGGPAERATREPGASHDIGESLDDLRLALADSHAAVRAEAVEHLADRGDRAAIPLIARALADPSTEVREAAASALGRLGDRSAVEPLMRSASDPAEDEWVRLHAAESAALLGEPAGAGRLIELAGSAGARLVRSRALAAVARLAGVPPQRAGDDPDAPAADRLRRRLERWYESHREELAWDPEAKAYRPGAGP